MDFADFVKKCCRDVHDASQRGALQRIGRALDRARGLQSLLEKGDASLEPFTGEALVQLSEAHRGYLRWKEAATQLRRVLSRSGITLPDGSLDFAYTPQELQALGRAARMCPRSGFADHEGWSRAIRAHVDLWTAAVELSLSQGQITVRLEQPDHPEAEEHASQVTARADLEELSGHRWLATQRGVSAGALSFTLSLPWDEIEDQARARLDTMGLGAQQRGPEAIVQELIRDDLEASLLSVLNRRSESRAVQSSRTAYSGLLSTPPLDAERVLAVFVGKEGTPIGAALIDRRGEVLEHATIDTEDGLDATIGTLIESGEPTAAVVPASSSDQRVLERAERALDSLPITRIHTAGLREARGSLPFDPPAASAVVLGRRAVRPAREWGRVNPLSLGLGEYPRDVDDELLAAVLAETKALSSFERRRKSSPTKARPAPKRQRLNPMVRTIRDLKAGMTVNGVVTNLTKFGAFVNIGLGTEAMIHISQLSEEFVDDPAQVLRVGENVEARVIEVIPEKSRIALSLKAPPEQSPGGKPSRGRQPPKSRSSALADLDALFKK